MTSFHKEYQIAISNIAIDVALLNKQQEALYKVVKERNIVESHNVQQSTLVGVYA